MQNARTASRVPRVTEAQELADTLRATGHVTSHTLYTALANVPRQLATLAVTDRETATPGWVAPEVIGRALEFLGIVAGPGAAPQKVLEIGTGNGYSTAALCELVGDENVVSIDIDRPAIVSTRTRLGSLHYFPRLIVAPGECGWCNEAPYDRIVSWTPVDRVPWVWSNQLSVGGRLVVALRATDTDAYPLVLDKTTDGLNSFG